MRISDWSSDVCSSDLHDRQVLVDGELGDAEGGARRTTEQRQGDALAGALIDQDTEVQSPIEQLHGLAGAVDALGHAAPIAGRALAEIQQDALDRKSTTSELQSLMRISYAVFCLKTKTD